MTRDLISLRFIVCNRAMASDEEEERQHHAVASSRGNIGGVYEHHLHDEDMGGDEHNPRAPRLLPISTTAHADMIMDLVSQPTAATMTATSPSVVQPVPKAPMIPEVTAATATASFEPRKEPSNSPTDVPNLPASPSLSSTKNHNAGLPGHTDVEATIELSKADKEKEEQSLQLTPPTRLLPITTTAHADMNDCRYRNST